MNSEELRKQIAEQLKAARINAGITVTEAAEALGKNKNTIYGYELGRILPTADVFLQVMVLYGIKNFDLFLLGNQIQFAQEESVVQNIDHEEQEMLQLMQNADEQGKAAAKAVLQTFQRKTAGQNDAGNIVRFIK